MGKMRVRHFIFIFLFLLGISIFSYSASAQQNEEQIISLDGDQLSPSVYGRYIVYLQDIGNNKYEVHVYDSGDTIKTEDDKGVIILTNDGKNHQYSSPVIDKKDGRYIAWLDKNDIYYIDLGEDRILHRADPILKLDILNTIQKPDGTREYTVKDNLALYNGILVWEDYDSKNLDSDIRGYNLKDKISLGITDQKIKTIAEQNFRIEEKDPFIVGDNIVFIQTDLVDKGDLGVDEGEEVYRINFMNKQVARISRQNDGCSASEPSINLRGDRNVWVESCGFSRIVIDMEVIKGAAANEIFYSPRSDGRNPVHFIEQDAQGVLTLNNGRKVTKNLLDIDTYRLVYNVRNNGIDIAFLDISAPSRILSSLESISDNQGRGIFSWGVYNYDPNIKITTAYIQKVDSSRVFSPIQPIVLYEENYKDRDRLPRLDFFSNSQDGAIAIWTTFSPTKISKMQIFNADGSLKFNEPIQIPILYYPTYISDEQGEVIIFDKDGDTLSVQFLTQSGNYRLPEAVLLPGFTSNFGLPNDGIIADYKRGAILARQYWIEGGKINIDGLFIRSDGARFPAEQFIKISSGDSFAKLAVFVPDQKGGAILGLTQIEGPDDTSVRFNFLNSDGKLRFNEPVKFLDEPPPHNITFAIPINPEGANIGGAVVVWTQISPLNSLTSIINAQIINPDGSLKFNEPLQLTDKGVILSVISDMLGGAIVIWGDGEKSLYAQIFNADGSLKFNEPIKVVESRDPRLYLQYYSVVPDQKGGAIISFDSPYDEKNIFVYFLDITGKVNEVIVPIYQDLVIFPNAGTSITFLRGDANNDEQVNLADAVFLLNYLFKGGEAPVCEDAADTDDSGGVSITDAIRLLNYLFKGGEAIAQPYPDSGEDPTPDSLLCR